MQHCVEPPYLGSQHDATRSRSSDACSCRSISAACAQPAADIDRRDRQTDGRTPDRYIELHRIHAGSIGKSVSKSSNQIVEKSLKFVLHHYFNRSVLTLLLDVVLNVSLWRRAWLLPAFGSCLSRTVAATVLLILAYQYFTELFHVIG